MRNFLIACGLILISVTVPACNEDKEVGWFGGKAWVYMRTNKDVPGDSQWYTTGACQRDGSFGEDCDLMKFWGVWVETARLDSNGCIINWSNGSTLKCTGFRKWSINGPDGMLDGQKGPWAGRPPLP